MLHKMKLNESPFERIKNGTKMIEFRLYDEKKNEEKDWKKVYNGNKRNAYVWINK